jgi:hypothetical protein
VIRAIKRILKERTSTVWENIFVHRVCSDPAKKGQDNFCEFFEVVRGRPPSNPECFPGAGAAGFWKIRFSGPGSANIQLRKLSRARHPTSNVEHASHLIRHPTQRRAALLVISSEVACRAGALRRRREKSLNVPLRAVANIQIFNIEHLMLRI